MRDRTGELNAAESAIVLTDNNLVTSINFAAMNWEGCEVVVLKIRRGDCRGK